MPVRREQSLKTMEKIRLCFLAAFRRTRRSGSACPLAAGIAKGICLALIAVSFNLHQVAAAENDAPFSDPVSLLSAIQVAGTRPTVATQPAAAPHPRRANFEGEHKSDQTRHMADWVMDSGDNRSLPFAIIDKMDAKVFVFDAHGRLRGAAPVLLGIARGDYTVPGIGDRKLSDIRPEERTTPAGRFVASLGYNFNGKGRPLGGLQKCRFSAPGDYEQSQGAPPGAPGLSSAARQAYFLWLHQCSCKVLR